MLSDITTQTVFAFFLIFSRIGTGLFIIPTIGEVFIQPRIRLTISLIISSLLLPLIQEKIPAMPESPAMLLLLIMGEMFIGLAIGAAVRFILSAMHVAGMIISYQSGLAAAVLFDPYTK